MDQSVSEKDNTKAVGYGTSNAPLSLKDLPDDMLRVIGTILCPEKVYHVWNVLARVDKRFHNALKEPDFAHFDAVVYNTKWRYDTDIKEMHMRCGRPHRDGDLPAVIYGNDDREWWKHGKKHRDNDLPAVQNTSYELQFYNYNDGNCQFERNEMLYKERIEGRREWWVDGQRHRENDMPALLREDGSKEWWIRGKCIRTWKPE